MLCYHINYYWYYYIIYDVFISITGIIVFLLKLLSLLLFWLLLLLCCCWAFHFDFSHGNQCIKFKSGCNKIKATEETHKLILLPFSVTAFHSPLLHPTAMHDLLLIPSLETSWLVLIGSLHISVLSVRHWVCVYYYSHRRSLPLHHCHRSHRRRRRRHHSRSHHLCLGCSGCCHSGWQIDTWGGCCWNGLNNAKYLWWVRAWWLLAIY